MGWLEDEDAEIEREREKITTEATEESRGSGELTAGEHGLRKDEDTRKNREEKGLPQRPQRRAESGELGEAESLELWLSSKEKAKKSYHRVHRDRNTEDTEKSKEIQAKRRNKDRRINQNRVDRKSRA